MTAIVEKQDNLRFDGVKFFSVDFEILGSPKDDEDIVVDIVPKLSHARDSDTKFEIIYNVSLTIEDVFTLQLTAIGYFELSLEVLENENLKDHLIHANAPAIVFPYLRSFISMFTSNLGTIPALTLPTQFFKGKLEEYYKKD